MADDGKESQKPDTEETLGSSGSDDEGNSLVPGGENDETAKTFKDLVSLTHMERIRKNFSNM